MTSVQERSGLGNWVLTDCFVIGSKTLLVLISLWIYPLSKKQTWFSEIGISSLMVLYFKCITYIIIVVTPFLCELNVYKPSFLRLKCLQQWKVNSETDILNCLIACFPSTCHTITYLLITMLFFLGVFHLTYPDNLVAKALCGAVPLFCAKPAN